MTTEITQTPTDTGISLQCRNYMAALSLAEQLISETDTLPAAVEINVHPWAPGAPEIRFYFHHDVQGLRRFRDDQMLTETRTDRPDSVYLEATRDFEGVRVVAWTLLDADGNAAVAA